MSYAGRLVKVGQVWQSNTTGKKVEITEIRGNEAYAKEIHPQQGQSNEFGTLLPDGTAHSSWDSWSLEEVQAQVSQSKAHREAAGMYCGVCHQFYPMAVPNRPSGKMACWSCRQGWIPPGL